MQQHWALFGDTRRVYTKKNTPSSWITIVSSRECTIISELMKNPTVILATNVNQELDGIHHLVVSEKVPPASRISDITRTLTRSF